MDAHFLPLLAVLQAAALDVGLIAALIGAVATVAAGVIAYANGKSSAETARASLTENLRTLRADYNEMEKERTALRREAAEMKKLADRYREVRKELQNSSMVRNYHQPVLLVGPRGVGKTSLMMQWHAPWDYRLFEGTSVMQKAVVPIHDFTEADGVPHFADPTVKTRLEAHLHLTVFDFPGELDGQRTVRQVAVEEMRRLNSNGRAELGIVLICLFNAEEARTGISRETRDYYNGRMFHELHTLMVDGAVAFERILLVFNRYDLLREVAGHEPSDVDLLHECMREFDDVYAPLRKLCNPDQLRATFTVLSREELREKNRGAPIVLGEAARPFVKAYAGSQAVGELIKTPRAVPVPGSIFAAPPAAEVPQ